MKKAFKLFGFIALSMTLAVACGNANNTPAEEEVVAEETVEATEQVAEQVAAPATESTEEVVCDEKKQEACNEKDIQKEIAKEKANTTNATSFKSEGEAKIVKEAAQDAKEKANVNKGTFSAAK